MRLTRLVNLAVAANLLAAVLFVSGAFAQTQQQIDWCVNKGRSFSPDLRIGDCTASIQSGRWAGKDLAWAYNNRGNAYDGAKDYDRAIADYNQAIALDPKYAAAFNGRCWDRAIVGQLQAALADCNRSLALRPNDAAALNSRGLVQLKLGAFDAAIADYSAAIAQNANDAASLYARGVAKLKKGDTTGGNADIAAAKAIQPDIDKVYAGYGVT